MLATRGPVRVVFPGDHTLIELGGIDPVGGFDRVLRSEDMTLFLRGEAIHRLDGPAVMRTRSYGNEVEWRLDGVLHRGGGPAAEAPILALHTDRFRHLASRTGLTVGNRRWMVARVWAENGLIHRVDGPSIVWRDGTEEWFDRGFRSRERLPAVMCADGTLEWHFAGATADPPVSRDFMLRYNTGRHQFFNSFYREVGPSVITPDGTRIWGEGGQVNDSEPPPHGPWIEYPDGSIRFADTGRLQAASSVAAVDWQRRGRLHVDACLREVGLRLESFVGNGRDQFPDDWHDADVDLRRQIATRALWAFRVSAGCLPRQEEDELERWTVEFERIESGEREEIRVIRQDFAGHLGVALRRLPSPVPDLAGLEAALHAAWLPVEDVGAIAPPGSHLLQLAVRIPDIDSAVPANPGVGDLVDPIAFTSRRTLKSRAALYAKGVAEVALGTLAVARRLSPHGVEAVVLNVMVEHIDKATGRERRFCILSVRTDWETFDQLELENVDARLCVKALGGIVPDDSNGVAAVRPIVDFDVTDARIVTSRSTAPGLDSRPNLMELSPSDFESLIQNLFEKIGLDTHLTRSSRDGGVDCIAYDTRPIFGGKIVIQAKRYKNTVGVSAVRDLYGTMLNEGATKGILVTTSSYGRASFEFAQNKPLELLEGGHLLHLLEEHLGISARIEPPENWIDPNEGE